MRLPCGAALEGGRWCPLPGPQHSAGLKGRWRYCWGQKTITVLVWPQRCKSRYECEHKRGCVLNVNGVVPEEDRGLLDILWWVGGWVVRGGGDGEVSNVGGKRIDITCLNQKFYERPFSALNEMGVWGRRDHNTRKRERIFGDYCIEIIRQRLQS